MACGMAAHGPTVKDRNRTAKILQSSCNIAVCAAYCLTDSTTRGNTPRRMMNSSSRHSPTEKR